MMISDKWLTYLIGDPCFLMCQWMLLNCLFKTKWSWKSLAWMELAGFPGILLKIFMISQRVSALSYFINFAWLFFSLWVLYGQRGLQIVKGFVVQLIVMGGTDFVILAQGMLIYGVDWGTVTQYASEMSVSFAMVMLLPTFFYYLLVIGLIELGRWLARRIRIDSPRFRTARLIVCIALLVVVLLVGMAQLHFSYTAEDMRRLAQLTITYIVIAVLALMFIAQDVRYLKQAKYNETLDQRQKAIEELLASMRSFRHNIANLLYGMEGAVLAGEADETRDYYNQMVEKCTLINSENIMALQAIPLPALSALILRKLDEAYRKRIPIYLYVEPKLSLRGLRPSDLCEVVGVLIDNALEAAESSVTPYVSIELRKLERGTEIDVRNTFRTEGEPTLPDEWGQSSKAKHEGIGLYGVREVIARYPNAFFNLHVAGRYVEAQVLAE